MGEFREGSSVPTFSVENGLLPGGTYADRVVGSNLRRMRIARGATEADVMSTFLCRARDIARVESGELRPNASLLRAISKFCRCEVSDLFMEL